MGYKVALLPGDGVGPEIVGVTTSILRLAGFDPEYVTIEGGFDYYKRSGKPLQEDALDLIKRCDTVLKGPIATLPGPGTYESVNVHLRKELDLYVNFRPFKTIAASRYQGVDIIIFRENTEEIYSGIEWGSESAAVALRVITRRASQRLIQYAFNYARKNRRRRMTAVHKATILKETDGLFRKTFFEISSDFSDIKADEILVDAAAYQLVKEPQRFDVMVMPNSYGDILSDMVAGIVGSLGLCGSGNIGDNYAVFEPVHGVAWDIANKNVANPTGMILSGLYMLRWLGERKEDRKLLDIAAAVEKSIWKVINKPVMTQELGGTASLSSFAEQLENELGEAAN